MMQSRNMDAPITVFIADGVPLGTCQAGQENEWMQRMQAAGGNKIGNITQMSSTERRWHAYRRARDQGASAAEAVQELKI